MITSVVGTFETCLPILRMSVHRGRPEVAVIRSNRCECPLRTFSPEPIIKFSASALGFGRP
jgi:hypothetical protein